ncbi:MAG: staygreen family protein [Turicibacter sp.]|nr:staygreen family protein [Turicibacter sp.]MDO5793859.1 staygreen family protein [Turicibacter sp.]
MSTLNLNKLWINYRLSNLSQLYPRRYTLTHSDETAELFLVIGPEFAYEKFTSLRDEVIGEWLTNNSGQYYFYIRVRVDGIDDTQSSIKRNDIFVKHLPLALSAIKQGDPHLFYFYPQFLKAPIYVYFQSQDSNLNRTECYGSFSDY